MVRASTCRAAKRVVLSLGGFRQEAVEKKSRGGDKRGDRGHDDIFERPLEGDPAAGQPDEVEDKEHSMGPADVSHGERQAKAVFERHRDEKEDEVRHPFDKSDLEEPAIETLHGVESERRPVTGGNSFFARLPLL